MKRVWQKHSAGMLHFDRTALPYVILDDKAFGIELGQHFLTHSVLMLCVVL